MFYILLCIAYLAYIGVGGLVGFFIYYLLRRHLNNEVSVPVLVLKMIVMGLGFIQLVLMVTIFIYPELLGQNYVR